MGWHRSDKRPLAGEQVLMTQLEPINGLALGEQTPLAAWSSEDPLR